MEIDALNALVRLQHRTNELLEQLVNKESVQVPVAKTIRTDPKTNKRQSRQPLVKG